MEKTVHEREKTMEEGIEYEGAYQSMNPRPKRKKEYEQTKVKCKQLNRPAPEPVKNRGCDPVPTGEWPASPCWP